MFREEPIKYVRENNIIPKNQSPQLKFAYLRTHSNGITHATPSNILNKRPSIKYLNRA